MEIKALKDKLIELKKQKEQGKLADPEKVKQLKKREAQAQVDYTPEYECTYEGNQYIDVKTRMPPPDEIIKQIDHRVDLLKPTLPSPADKLIEAIENMEELEW